MTVRTMALVVLLTSLGVAVLHESAAVVAPVFVSLLIAYALDPIVSLIMRTGVSRIGAALLTYLMLGIIVGSLAKNTVAHVSAFAADLPAAAADAGRIWRTGSLRTSSPLVNMQRAAAEIDGAVSARSSQSSSGARRVQAIAPPFNVNEYLASFGASAALTGTEAAIVGVLSFLMICSGDVYKRKLIAIGGRAFESRRLTAEVIRAIDLQIQRYLLVRLLISAIVAAATAIGLWFVGLSHALVWGVIAGALNVLPFIGPTVAVAMITAAAFLKFKTIELTLTAGAVAAFVAALEGNLITPALASRAGEINTVAVFVSVLFFGWLWGVAGLLLAVPMAVAVKAAADHIEPLQPLGELLGL